VAAKRRSAKAALASSYAGPIAIAILLAGGLEGVVVAVRDPIDALVCSGLNLILRQAPTVSFRLNGATPDAFLFMFLTVLAALVFGTGLWLGIWLYPADSTSGTPAPGQN
jgi:hypothetical protein